MRHAHANTSYAGFSLVEVMVAVLVISIGLLGIARMQAMALASSGSARLRSLAALEAASLASTIRADRAYWATAAAVGKKMTVEIVDAAVTSATDTTLTPGTAPDCTSTAGTPACAPAEMAAYDLSEWASGLNALLRHNTAEITCQRPLATVPVSCSIMVSWAENLIAANSKEKNGTMALPQYTLYVDP